MIPRPCGIGRQRHVGEKRDVLAPEHIGSCQFSVYTHGGWSEAADLLRLRLSEYLCE